MMRLDDKYLEMAYVEANIRQKTDELQKKGYQVIDDQFFDLLVEGKGEKLAYEFKYRNGGNRRLQIGKLMEKAEEIGAELIVVYMARPDRDTIEFDELGSIIEEYFSVNFPEDLDVLSTHTRITEVYIESITNICLLEKNIQLSGEASVTVSLQYGSDRDQEEDDEESWTFPMGYDITMNWNKDILDMDYNIDTDSFYK